MVERKLKMTDYHAEIRSAIDQFEFEHAQQLLEQALKNPDAETYYLAAHVAIDKEQQVDFLQKALQLDRFHQKAQLALKSGKLRQPSEDVETENVSVMMASVKRLTPLYVIPHLKGTHCEKLAAGSVVMPLTCGPHAEWFNVLYRDNRGIQSMGWLPIQDLDDFMLEGTVPFVKMDEKQVTILDKDSINVPFTSSFDEFKNAYSFKFEKKESDKYSIQMLPNTFEDFFGNVNDTLNYVLKTKSKLITIFEF